MLDNMEESILKKILNINVKKTEKVSSFLRLIVSITILLSVYVFRKSGYFIIFYGLLTTSIILGIFVNIKSIGIYKSIIRKQQEQLIKKGNPRDIA